MPSFAEKLLDARNAAHMTQEELAAAIGVTRTTVSSWENGRTQPNLQDLQRLYQVLGRNFSDESGKAPAGPAEAGNASADAPAAQKRKKWQIPALCAVLAVLAVCAVLWLVLRPRAAETNLPPAVKVAADQLTLKEPEKYTVSWFKEGNVRAEGEPWLVFSPSVKVDTQSQSDPFWYYKLGFTEAAGHSFTLDWVNEYIFWAEDEYHMETVPAANVWKDENKEEWEYGGGMPVQDILCSGFLVVGHDAQGHPISFRSYVDFTSAPRE